VAINEDHYDGETVFCDRHVTSLRLDQDGYYTCHFGWSGLPDVSNTVRSEPLELLVLCKLLSSACERIKFANKEFAEKLRLKKNTSFIEL
jgi:hypothetical protein